MLFKVLGKEVNWSGRYLLTITPLRRRQGGPWALVDLDHEPMLTILLRSKKRWDRIRLGQRVRLSLDEIPKSQKPTAK